MITIYKNGKEFIDDNHLFLDENKYMSVFFYADAKVLNETTNNNFAVKAEANNKRLLGIKVEPYNLLLYGDKECTNEMLEYLNDNDYKYNGIMCSTEIGDVILKSLDDFHLSIGMDYMEATTPTEKASQNVRCATLDDVEEIFELSFNFIKDCGLTDIPNKEKTKDNINNFRVIKIDNKIVSMASFSYNTEDSYRITHVYTIPEYRGNGYASAIVSTIKNEIIGMGKIATLNVDQANPISYHIYESLGFKKVFSQGIYLKKKKI